MATKNKKIKKKKFFHHRRHHRKQKKKKIKKKKIPLLCRVNKTTPGIVTIKSDKCTSLKTVLIISKLRNCYITYYVLTLHGKICFVTPIEYDVEFSNGSLHQRIITFTHY